MTFLLEVTYSSDLFIYIGNSYFIRVFVFFFLFFFDTNRDLIFKYHFICYLLRIQIRHVY